MTAISGKWKLVSTSNLEEYHNVIKTSEEYKERLRKLAAARKTNPDCYVEEFQIDTAGGTISRKVFVENEKKREVNYKFGGVNDGTSEDGRPLKLTFGHEGDNKVTFREEGSGFAIDGVIEKTGNELKLSLSSQGVTSVASYTKI